MMGTHWDFSWIYCCCPMYGEPKSLILQDQPFHLLQQITDGMEIGFGPTHTPVSGPRYLTDWSALQIFPVLTSSMSSLAFSWLVYPYSSEQLASQFCFHIMRIRSPTHLCNHGQLALLCCLGEMQGHSRDCCSWWGPGTALSFLWPQGHNTCLCCKEVGVWRVYIPHLCHHMTDEAWGQVIFSCSQSQLTCSPIYQASSTVLPRLGIGPTFLNVITGKGEGQLPCQLEVEELRR